MSARTACLIGLMGMPSVGCGSGDVSAGTAAEVLEHPLLTFDVVEIPRAGGVELVSGDVEILTEEQGWMPLTNGARLQDEARLRIGAGAALIIRFSATELVEFRPAGKERWIVLDAQEPREDVP